MHLFLKMAIPGLFLFIFVFTTVDSNMFIIKKNPMTRLERRTSGIGSDRSAN